MSVDVDELRRLLPRDAMAVQALPLDLTGRDGQPIYFGVAQASSVIPVGALLAELSARPSSAEVAALRKVVDAARIQREAEDAVLALVSLAGHGSTESRAITDWISAGVTLQSALDSLSPHDRSVSSG